MKGRQGGRGVLSTVKGMQLKEGPCGGGEETEPKMAGKEKALAVMNTARA